MALLVAWVVLLERLPVITEDLLKGVFVDPLPCGYHSARLYYVLAAEASRLFTLLSPSRSLASPRRDGQNTGFEKRKFLYAQGKALTVLTKTKEGKPKRYTLFTLRDWQPPQPKEHVDKMPTTAHLRFGRSTLEQRLTASSCESCGKAGGYFAVHHVRKLKDLQGKEWWEQVMSYRKRKTMILCIECHDLLHAHQLSNRQKKF
jgi:hypothetical protein